MRFSHTFRIFALVAAVSLFAAACASQSASSAEAAADMLTATHDAASELEATPHIDVDVILDDFTIEMSQTEFNADAMYMFTVVNVGEIEHEVMFMPQIETTPGMDMEALDELAVAVFEEDDLGPGAGTAQLVSFKSGDGVPMEAACRLPGHYEAGMKLPITVVG